LREQPHEVRTNRTIDAVGISSSEEFATRDAGPTVERALSTLWDGRVSRGRVAEWPVTDPILRYWY